MITKGKILLPPRITLYGVEGIGKSNFGACAADPLFLPTEDGSNELDVARFPLCESWEKVAECLEYVLANDIEYRTLVVDSIDWLEKIIWRRVCKEKNIQNIEDAGYGKGYTFAIDKWILFLSMLDRVRLEKKMAVVLIAHAEVKRYDSPESEPYDRYQMKLHKSALAIVTEWSDALLFANYRVIVRKTDVGFKKEVRRAVESSDYRLIYCNEKPAFRAKNRYGLPDELPFEKNQSWSTLMEAIKKAREEN